MGLWQQPYSADQDRLPGNPNLSSLRDTQHSSNDTWSGFQSVPQLGYQSPQPEYDVATTGSVPPPDISATPPASMSGGGPDMSNSVGVERIVDARSGPDPALWAQQQADTVPGAPGAAHSRTALLHQALVCNLCQFLVADVIEPLASSSSTAAMVRDPAAAQVHAIALIKLLCRDPGFGPKFQLLLKDLPAWNKYKAQDYSLLITTGQGQATDYFLTNAESSGGDNTKLLMER
jgi:hypothetical protein